MMARRARMSALLQLSSLVLLLVVKLTHTAPVSDGSDVRDGGDGILEKHIDEVHTEAPGDSVAEGDHHAVTVQDVNSVLNEEVDMHEDPVVTKATDDASSVDSAKQNVDKDVDSTSTKSEDEAGVAEENKEVPEENADIPKNSLLIKSEGIADGALAVSEANVDEQEDSQVTKTEENGKTTESSNIKKLEDHTSTENEEDTSTRETNGTVSVEKNEDPATNKSGENANDAESKENLGIADDFIIGVAGKDASTSEDSEESLEENMHKHEVKAAENEPGKEQIITAVVDEDSEGFVEASKDNKVEKDAVESSDEGSEENMENERAEESALEKDDTSEDEITEERNKEMEGQHGAVLGNSSEETSEAKYEAGDVEVNESQGSTHQESHVTSSPFARLSMPHSSSHHVEKDEQHSDKDAVMEGHEKNLSIEETEEKEAGSPDELIENDRVDSEVIQSDNKTAALGKAMPITGAEKDAENEDESSEKDAENEDQSLAEEDDENEDGSLAEKDAENGDESSAEKDAENEDENLAEKDAENEDESSAEKDAENEDESLVEKDAENEDESLEDTSKDSVTPAVLKELEKSEGKNVIEHQALNNENEEKVETTINEAPKSTNETNSKVIVLGGKLLDDDNEEESEKHNLLDKDDMLSKAPLDYSSNENENEFHVDEATLNVAHVTENRSEEEGSGIALDMVGFASHGDDAYKDTSDTSSQEEHEAENRKEEKEGNQDDEDAVASEKEATNLSKETGHHIHDFGESGSGQEEELENIGKQDNDGTNDVEDGDGSGGYALPGHYEDMTSVEHITKSILHSVVSHVPVVGDNEESSTENSSESPAPENETSTKTTIFESADDQHGSGDPFKEENLVQNNTNVQVMSLSSTAVPDESGDHHVTFDGSGDDDTTTPVAIIVYGDIIGDTIEVPSMEMDLVNSSLIGEASPGYQEKPVQKLISSQSAAAPPPENTEGPCISYMENEDCLLQRKKLHEHAGVTNILEDDDEVPPEPTKGGVHTESTASDHTKEQAVISTTPVMRVSTEEDSSQQSIVVDVNKPLLNSNEETRSTTIAPEIQEITESIEDHEAVDNETANIGAPDTIVEHPQDDTGIKEMSGKIRAANVNELGVSGQENSDDLGEPEALDSSSASGSYVVLGCIMAVVVVLLAYAAIKSRRERGNNPNSKKQSEVAADDDDGTELKDMKKALLPPETLHDDCNGDIEANRKPLMDKDGDQEEDEEKEPIIKQNGTLELSEIPKDLESQVDTSTAENQQKTASTPNKPPERNGLSEVVVEKPAISNGKADSIITHPVAAKVKVIENEDSIAKIPVIINRGANSPPH